MSWAIPWYLWGNVVRGVHAGCTGCMRGPRDGKGYVAIWILIPPPLGPKVGAVVETHTLWYFGHHCCLVVGFDALGIRHFWIFTFFHAFLPFCTHLHHIQLFSGSISPHYGDPKKAGVMYPAGPIVDAQPSGAVGETGSNIVNLPILLNISGSQISSPRSRPVQLG